MFSFCFVLNYTATTEIYTYCHTLSLHDALPIFIIEWGDFMNASTKKMLLAAAAGLSFMTASPAAGQEPVAPVKIGVMDLEVKGLAFSDSNTMIEYQAFTPEGAKEGKQTTRSGEDHGVIVASAVVRQYRLLDPKSPIEVYEIGRAHGLNSSH